MSKDNSCKICGRNDYKFKNNICNKHHRQYVEYGFYLDSNMRDERDLNEIITHSDYAEIVLYDKFQEELDERVLIDLEDIDKISSIRWDKRFDCIVGKKEGLEILIQNQILDTNSKIKFEDGNILNCRKSNLHIVENKRKNKNIIVSKKNKNKVIIEFVGKSNTQVTGSSILISIPITDGNYKKILVEFGGNQTNKDLYTEHLMNKEIVESVPCHELDYAFILHNHFDHIANLPALIPNGFNGRIISNHENAELVVPILLDGAYIMNKNIKSINSKKHKVEPLYTESDVYLMINRIDKYDMNKIHELTPEISFQFVNAGHILGSCQLILYLKTPSGQIKKIHITSDLGSNYNKQPFVKEKDIVTSSNVSIFEATYNRLDRGFNSKKEVSLEREQFKDFIKNELRNRRNMLIGVFAQSRQQTMMEFLYNTFKDDESFKYPIYVDGVLGLNLNNVYLNVLKGKEKEYWRDVMSWKNFHYIHNFEKSQEVALNKDETKIVISSSGMFSNGRVMNHVKTMIEDKKCTIVLCGYQGEGTVGHELMKENAKTVKIEGLEYKKQCKIHKLNTWSSHIMPMENIAYMSQVRTPLIIIHHSDDNKHKFRDIVEQELRTRNNSAKVECATEDKSIYYI